MRSPVNRRAARVTGVATVAVIALAGCSAGQVAETAILQPPISGLNTQSADGSLLIRNLEVLYNSPTGYPAEGTAPLQLSLYNQTTEQMTVVIGSVPQEGIVSAKQVGLTGGTAAASPSANPEPSGNRPSADPNPSASEVIEPGSTDPTGTTGTTAPTGAPAQPARITLPALSSVSFLAGGKQSLLASGLSDKLVPGNSLSLVFQVGSSTQPLTVQAPFAVPLSPASRAPGLEHENSEE